MSAEAWNSLILECADSNSLSTLLAVLLDLPTLRRIAIAKGIGAKGFRVEKASAQRLAPLLVKEAAKHEGLRGELAAALAQLQVGSQTQEQESVKSVLAVDPVQVKALELRLGKAEKKSLREAASARKARESLQKSLEDLEALARSEADLRRQLSQLSRDCEELRARVQESREPAAERQEKRAAQAHRERVRLEERVEDLEQLDRAHRLDEADFLSRIRELESLVQELDALLPRGKKERIKQFRKSQVERKDTPGLVLLYSREFLDALERITESDQHRIHVTLAQVVLGGLDQHGLRVKSLKGGGELLSLRSGLHYRVYFTRSGDRLYLHHVGTREEQDTFLKKWRG